jgi:myo-inositol 2-dehydrogenase/D-chiro-inositol 1-dehydrogenase
MSSYITSLAEGKEVPVGGQDIVMSLKIGLAALKSIKEKRPVRIDEIK